MIHRIHRKKYLIKALDIETHNDKESIEKGETSMWLGCYLDENSKVDDPESYFYSMDELLDRLEEETKRKYKKGTKTRRCANICIYIYNLSFEYSFLLPALLKRGFSFKEEITKDDEYVYNSVSTRSCSSVWEVNLKFRKSNGCICMRDLSKTFGGGLGKVAKSFGLSTQKGEIEYTLNRLHEHIITQEEKEYCYKDTRIIIEILKIMDLRDDKPFWSEMSMASYSMRHLLKRGYPRSTKPYQAFRKDYPMLSKEENDFLRNGVEGGLCYANTEWQFKNVNQEIYHIDAHQMYPTQLFENFYPYGKGHYFKGKSPYPYGVNCCHVLISYDDVILHSVIKLIGLPFCSKLEITLWDIEIELMQRCYVNLKVEYIDGYHYDTKPLPFKRYYEDNYNRRLVAKQKGDSFNILYYKLLNNSSYGKFLEKPHNEIIENIIDEDGIITSIVREKPKEEWKDNAKYTYLPIGSLTTAYARVCLVSLALELDPTGKNILYFDTDSIFFIATPETLKVWSTIDQEDHLGGWALEEILTKAQFTAPKRYKTEDNKGNVSVKAGGINFGQYMIEKGIDKLSYEEVNIISSKWQVRRAYRVKGGTIIDFQEKEMSVQDKYLNTYRRNYGG